MNICKNWRVILAPQHCSIYAYRPDKLVEVNAIGVVKPMKDYEIIDTRNNIAIHWWITKTRYANWRTSSLKGERIVTVESLQNLREACANIKAANDPHSTLIPPAEVSLWGRPTNPDQFMNKYTVVKYQRDSESGNNGLRTQVEEDGIYFQWLASAVKIVDEALSVENCVRLTYTYQVRALWCKPH